MLRPTTRLPFPHLVCWLLLAGLGCGLGAGPAPVAACDQFAVHQRLFFTGNGLPEDAVVGLADTASGQVFVGLENQGVVVIEQGQLLPRRLKMAGSRGGDETVSQRTKALAIDNKDQLWVGTAAGLFVFSTTDLGQRRAYLAGDGFADNIIQSVAACRDDVVVGTTRGLARSSAGFSFLGEKAGLPSDIVNAVAAFPDDAVAAGTALGAAFGQGTAFKRAAAGGEWLNAVCPALPRPSPAGESLAQVLTRTLRRFGEKFDAILPQRTDISAPEIEKVRAVLAQYRRLLFPDPGSHDFFVGGNLGVTLVSPEEEKSTQLLTGWTTALAVDQAGNLFAGQRGLAIHPVVAVPAFLERFDVGAMVREHARRILAGETATAASLVTLDGDGATPVRPPEGWSGDALEKKLAAAKITALSVDQRGLLWVGTSHAGLFCFQPVAVNAEQPIGILRQMNMIRRMEAQKAAQEKAAQEAQDSGDATGSGATDSGADQAGGDTAGTGGPSPSPDEETLEAEFSPAWYKVDAAQPEIDPEVRPLILKSVARWAQPTEFTYWIGRWSQLTEPDRERFLDLLVRYGDGYHLAKYLPLFFYDAYVTLPIGPGDEGRGGPAAASAPATPPPAAPASTPAPAPNAPPPAGQP